MRTYSVTLPIGGHAIVEVEAESEEAAIEAALEEVTTGHIDAWDVLHKVSSGNVLHFPQPWEIEVEDLGDAD